MSVSPTPLSLRRCISCCLASKQVYVIPQTMPRQEQVSLDCLNKKLDVLHALSLLKKWIYLWNTCSWTRNTRDVRKRCLVWCIFSFHSISCYPVNHHDSVFLFFRQTWEKIWQLTILIFLFSFLSYQCFMTKRLSEFKCSTATAVEIPVFQPDVKSTRLKGEKDMLNYFICCCWFWRDTDWGGEER